MTLQTVANWRKMQQTVRAADGETRQTSRRPENRSANGRRVPAAHVLSRAAAAGHTFQALHPKFPRPTEPSDPTLQNHYSLWAAGLSAAAQVQHSTFLPGHDTAL